MEMGCLLASTLGSPGQLPTLILSSRRGTTFGAPVTRLHRAADCDTGELSNPSCDPGIFQNIFRDLEKLAPQENKTRAGGWWWRWASPKAVAVSDAGREEGLIRRLQLGSMLKRRHTAESAEGKARTVRRTLRFCPGPGFSDSQFRPFLQVPFPSLLLILPRKGAERGVCLS